MRTTGFTTASARFRRSSDPAQRTGRIFARITVDTALRRLHNVPLTIAPRNRAPARAADPAGCRGLHDGHARDRLKRKTAAAFKRGSRSGKINVHKGRWCAILGLNQ
ncbi:hypothetical protein [Amycolatopsis thermoflava]|uniref:hypothetical protein n=1 Tax=Amycolatopsis thermoflava TaxID=84480 RepID=UPI003D734D3F